MKLFKTALIFLTCIVLAACGSSSNGSGNGKNSGSGGGNGPSPPTPGSTTGVNIGNISTIPLGNNVTNTFLVVTNNYPDVVALTSATYTVYNPSGAATAHDAHGVGSPVNVNQCAPVQGRGSCSVTITVPDNTTPDGQYLVTMNFRNSTTGAVYTTSQLVSYSGNVPTTSTEITFSTINNTVYNQAGLSTTYTVPFLLTTPLDNLSASSEYNNPAFAPAISCPGSGPYPAGTLCTLYIKISNTGTNSLISGNIIVNTSSLSNNTLKQSIGIKGQTGYLFNVPVTVVQNNIGNLITSAINAIINPADGAHAQSITLLNNGAAAITGISVTSTGVITASNGCSGTLNTGSSCTFTVNANQTSNGQSSVTVGYTSGTTNNVLAFNVAYIASATTPALTMSTSGTFNNTVINNSSRTLSILVTNASTANFTNINFTPSSAIPSGMTYVSSGGGSSCATNGTQSLSAGQNCTLQLQYAPTTTATGPSFIIRETAQYAAQDGSTGSYTASTVTINYTAIT